MISEEKVKIMAEMAKYEKNYGKGDFRIYKYTKKDYVRSEKIKTSIALLISFLIMTGLLCIMQLDIVIMKLREGKVIVSAADHRNLCCGIFCLPAFYEDASIQAV